MRAGAAHRVSFVCRGACSGRAPPRVHIRVRTHAAAAGECNRDTDGLPLARRGLCSSPRVAHAHSTYAPTSRDDCSGMCRV
eukprot:1218527-Pyramimonas_sp.AAC.1